MNILLLVPYPQGEAPSQRFRCEQYLNILISKNITYHHQSFLTNQAWQILYQPGKILQKSLWILYGFLRRFLLMFAVFRYDFVFIHREASPIGPPVFEWIIAKIWRKKIIYDFDDAIWLANTSEQNKIAARLKWHHKVSAICKWSYKVSSGNRYLADYALQYNKNVVINPTTIDTEGLHNPVNKKANVVFTIGWTGTHSTMPYLTPILPLLDELAKKYAFKLLIISNQKPEFDRQYVEFIKWNKSTEIEDLQKMDIGIMPLSDDKWAKGKCGFKALQYMSLKIPALVSPVGVNTEIVDHELNGFICESSEDWEQALTNFYKNPDLIETMAEACRKKIMDHYSVLSNKDNFIKLFT
ncbi:MAG: glycosyltransferase family 4 protein [Bacteroidota bacterium]